MVTNFETITAELSEAEQQLVPLLVQSFKKHTEANPIKAPDIVKKVNEFLFTRIDFANIRLTQPRLRKIVNHIRSNGLLPLMATSRGYYVSYKKADIKSQIRSLHERASGIQAAANGLKCFM
jgi:hypothetical protein